MKQKTLNQLNFKEINDRQFGAKRITISSNACLIRARQIARWVQPQSVGTVKTRSETTLHIDGEVISVCTKLSPIADKRAISKAKPTIRACRFTGWLGVTQAINKDRANITSVQQDVG